MNATFKLPQAPVNQTEAPRRGKSTFTPIDTAQLPTKEIAAMFKQQEELFTALKQCRKQLSAMLEPYFDPPPGKVVKFGFDYGLAFDFVEPRETKGKYVIEAPQAPAGKRK